MTIRSRLTVWYGVTFMLLIAIAGVVVWWQLETSLRTSTEDALRVHAADVVTDMAQGGLDLTALEPSLPGTFTAIVDPATGEIEAGPGVPTGLPPVALGASTRRLADDGPTFAFFSMSAPDGRVIVTGRSLAAVDETAARLPESLLALGTIGVIGSLVGGWWVAGRALAPIRRLTQEADAIGPHELSRRLPTAPQQDEIGRLTRTLNRFLGRIEKSVEHERAFIAGAAHDLRTPIAALRLQLDGLLRHSDIGDTARATLEKAQQDATDLGDLADALLELALAQTKGIDDSIEDRPLPMLVSRVEQDFEWAARQRNIRIEQSVDETSVRISEVRFHQALANLLSNAIRHSPEGGTVALSVHREPATTRQGPVVMTVVADEGAGVDPRRQDKLFTPFALTRGSSTRHGLGLATAAAAVESQGGRIGYRDDDGRSVFWFSMPIDSPEEAARSHERPLGERAEM